MFLRILCTFAVCCALVLSCSDEITNNYYQSTNGAVFGNVVPADSGTVELDGLNDLTAKIDADGFFNIANVPPGKYTLTILPQNHSKRIFEDIIVGTGLTTQLADVAIANYPYPIYWVTPADGSTNVSTYLYMSIVSDKDLDLNALNAATSFVPAVSGGWYVYYDDDDYGKVTGQYLYYFESSGYLESGTSYTMTIDAEEFSSSGVVLEGDLVISFTTRQLSLSLIVDNNPLTGGVSRREFSAEMRLPGCMLTDSVARTVRFEPAIEGQWFPADLTPRCDQSGYAREHKFLLTGAPLERKTTYKAFVDAAALGSSFKDTIEFTTEGFEVVDVRPRNTYYDVPPDNQVLVVFNESMDTASAQLAFSVKKANGSVVPGTFEWNAEHTEFMWSHWENLYSPGVYTITVTTDAKIESGENLDVGWESYFQVL